MNALGFASVNVHMWLHSGILVMSTLGTHTAEVQGLTPEGWWRLGEASIAQD